MSTGKVHRSFHTTAAVALGLCPAVSTAASYRRGGCRAVAISKKRGVVVIYARTTNLRTPEGCIWE